MIFLQAIVLGVVQGLTEFLPVSSSAHLVLIPWLFKWEDPGLAFDVALHWGTLIGVVIYYWRDLLSLAKGWVGSFQGQRDFENKLPWYLILATLPGALFGFLFEKQAESVFRSPLLIAGTLSGMGILLYTIDKKSAKNRPFSALTWSHVLLVGISQGFAIIPGISRSGITISTALLLGFNRSAAVQLSFLLSIPIIAGAGILKIHYLIENLGSPVLIAGVVSAALSGFCAIHFLVTFVRNKSFTPFVLYRMGLALFIIFVFLKW